MSNRSIIQVFALLVSITCLQAQTPSWSWARGGLGGDKHATECCVDAQGNVYVAGYLYGTEIFGNDTVYNSGVEDIFLAKYSPSGTPLWGRDIGGGDSEFCYGLVCDGQGNVFLTGSFRSSTLYVDTVPLSITSPGFQDCFVAKFDSSGTVRMALKFGGTEVDVGAAIVLGNNADLYLSGFYNSTNFNMGGTVLPAPELGDWFIAKLDTLGSVAWARTFGGPGAELGSHMALAPDGGIFFTGSGYSDTVQFDGIIVPNSAAGTADGFVLRLDGDGNVQWADHVGGMNNDYGVNLAVDANGNMYLAGDFDSPSIQVGPFVLSDADGEIFWSKWDPAGTVLYARAGGGASSCQLGDFEVTAGGDLVLGGSYLASQFAVDGLSISNPYYQMGNTSNLFLMRTDAVGEVVWMKGATQSEQDDIIHALALNADSSGYVAGYYEEGGINFDGHTVWDATLNNGGFFVARFDTTAGAGISEAALTAGLLIAPNPCGDRFMLQTDTDFRSMEILDRTGSSVPFQVSMRTTRTALVEVPLLANGLYLVVVRTDKGRSAQRFVRDR